MNNSSEIPKWTAAVIGVALVLVGVLGFVRNPIVGEPDWDPIFLAGTVHSIVHIVTGLTALAIAFALDGRQRALGLIAFGAVYALVLVATLVDPDLFGLFGHPVNAADHVLHLALTAVPIAVGWWDLQQQQRVRVT